MSAIAGLNPTTPTSAANGFSALSSEDFVRIMTSELSNQDPLAPSDSKAILEQISSIRSIESNLALKKSLESLTKQNEFATAGGLIGKNVFGIDDNGADVEGHVLGVSNTKEGALLNLENGSTVRMKNLLKILANDATVTPAPAQAAGSRGA